MSKKSKLNPRVSLIVLNLNGKVHLKEYFDSVFSQTFIPQQIILFDNGSIDGSCEFVKKHFSVVTIIKNKFNAGTALGSNLAANYVKGDLIIFQSNDLRLDRNCIGNLIQTITLDKRIGICTSIFLRYIPPHAHKPLIVENAGADVDRYGFNWPKYTGKNIEAIHSNTDIFGTYGSSFIIKRSLFQRIRGFDEIFFTLNDDIDLSWRVRLLGYKVVYEKKSIVFHKGHVTLGPLFSKETKRYWSERNALRSFIKNYTISSLIKYLPTYFLLLLAEFFYHLIALEFGLAYAVVKAVLWNFVYLIDTWRKRREIQSIRKISDTDISKKMYQGSLKLRFHALDRWRLFKVLGLTPRIKTV